MKGFCKCYWSGSQHEKWSFPITASSLDLFTFTKEMFSRKLHFLCIGSLATFTSYSANFCYIKQQTRSASRTSSNIKDRAFNKNSWRFLAFNYFCKKLCRRNHSGYGSADIILRMLNLGCVSKQQQAILIWFDHSVLNQLRLNQLIKVKSKSVKIMVSIYYFPMLGVTQFWSLQNVVLSSRCDY